MAKLPDFHAVQGENVLKAILRDKFARWAFFILVIMYLVVFLASFISPYAKEYSNRDKAYCPPSKIYVINEQGKLSLPYTYNYKRFLRKLKSRWQKIGRKT